MVQAGFYQRRKTNPGAVAAVVLLHGAVLTALVLAKEGNYIVERLRPTRIIDVPLDKPPPETPKPPQREPRQQDRITTVRIPDPLPPPPTWTPTQPPEFPTDRALTAGSDTLKGPPIADPLPPPPPPPEVKLQPARAKANLGSYVSDADYPSDAVRREEQGATRFRLAVGPDGRVTGCTVTASSGSAALDSATCRLMKSRARFAPARDSTGNAVADAVTSTIVWRLPAG
ncbi:MAG: energy transducer TonB [Alphaproteobacteria bacterium]|nr:energy transducer TonB [Alphaproteobacteria bacterium]